MKKFRLNSLLFISVIAVIFGCNLYYLARLYGSIRKDVEREVMTAMADADIDDLMCRAGRAQGLASNFTMQEESDEKQIPRRAEATTYRDENGQLISVKTEADGSVTEEKVKLSENASFSNQIKALRALEQAKQRVANEKKKKSEKKRKAEKLLPTIHCPQCRK